MRLSLTQRIEILMMIGYGDRIRTQQEVCILFNTKYPARPITRSTVSKLEIKFRETGSVEDIPRKGRPTIPDDKKLDILLAMEEDPHNSVRQISIDHGAAAMTVHNLLTVEKWHPFKIRLVHELNEDDPDRRMEFCQILMERCNLDPLFVENILFSDESTFKLNGEVNRQNCRYWAKENPRWMREHHTQYPQKINVWAGIVKNKIIGPYFFDNNVNGLNYLHFLQNFLIPTLVNLYPSRNNPGILDENLWYQQDGAPPHYAAVVRHYINQVFPNKWIGRRGPVEWPPRSPDLTPLDFFLWGHLKNVVYKVRPANIEDLKNRITTECRNISEETIRKVQQEFIDRLGYCQAAEGGQFQHLIK
jgi:hypothetical protein